MTDRNPATGDSPRPRVRLDRWLWAARFFRTRAQAKAAIEGGKVQVLPGGHAPRDGSPAQSGDFQKPKVSREVCVGDQLEVRRGWSTEVVVVTGLSEQRGNAAAAAELYRETPESIEAREVERARRRMEQAGLRMPLRRPSKRDRRELAKLKHNDPDLP